MRIVFIFLLLFLSKAGAEAYHLEIFSLDESNKPKKLPDYKKNPRDSFEAVRIIKQMITTLHEESYISAHIDTILFAKDSAMAYIFTGEKFNWVTLRKGNIDGYLLDRSGFRERFYRNKPFRYKEYNKLEKTFIQLSENNGFPFASIRLDSLELTQRGISATLDYQKGPFFTFDSITISGKTKTKKRYLMRHIRIYKGQTYSQQRVDDVTKFMKELSFLTQTRPPQIIFAKNKASLTLFLTDKKVNQIDGIVGFLPGSGANKKLLVTGQIDLALRNLFGTGKGVTIAWKKINAGSQTLDLNYIHPKLLGSNIDTRFDFNLLKQDSSFVTVLRKLTLSQRAGTYSKVSIITGLQTSHTIGTPSYSSSIRLSNYNYYTYGLAYDRNNLDNLYYPRRGWLFSIQGYLGNKTIHPDPNFDPSYYAGVKLKSVQFNLDGLAEKYTKLGKNSVFLVRLSGGNIFNNKNNLFFNDLYRIGGLKTLRGFNQNNFYASMYSVATLEYRYFTDETSYLLLFYDQGYVVNELSAGMKVDLPLGFGAGVSFTTPAGVFNFVYALGNSNDQKISLNLSKISFGITSRF